MAKRELSNTLRNLKFMQRASQREEKTKKVEEIKPDGSFVSTGALNRKCVVIMEGDPHPGTTKGRMSFQSFNPTIDKLNEEGATLDQPEASATCSGNLSGRTYSLNEDGPDCDANGDLKRKQPEVVPETHYPNKSPKKIQGNQQSSPNNSKRSYKQQKREKLDWSVLRPPKSQNK